MAQQYTYCYARVDANGWCYEVCSSTDEYNEEGYVAIPEYNEDYLMKYYNVNDGKWYEDAAFTIEWTPA